MVSIWNEKRINIDSWFLEQGGANKKNEYSKLVASNIAAQVSMILNTWLQQAVPLNTQQTWVLAAEAFNRAWLALTAVSEVEAMLLITGCLHWPCAS